METNPIAVISSTTRGLPEHRKAAEEACLRVNFFPKMMEHLGPRPDDAVTMSMQLVDEADVYVLILGPRYGEVPAGHDKSYTHLELDRAIERGIPRLVLLMDMDRHPLVGSDVETGPGAERLRELREQLRLEQGVGFFSSVDDMRAQLIHGLSRLKQNLRPDSSSMHYVRQLTSPPQPYVAHPYTLLQTADLVGRQRELNTLTDWVADRDSDLFRSPVLALVAIGGMGKSAVTWKWFNDIAPNEMPALSGRMWWSFYESDASFDNFVVRALAYVSRRPIEVVKRMRAGEREDELLDTLDRDPYLIVLDGLERLLIAYARADASRFADDDLDSRTANVVADALGLPASAAQSYTGQSRLRLAADPRTGAFLRRLAQVGASRILMSSRLFPAELQTVTGESVQGASAVFLTGLDPAEAVQLWRAFRVTGRRDELVKLFATFDNYPLLIRALAGEVARFRHHPGDFDAWRAAHSEFDPFRLPLTQRKAHVLLYSLRGLTEQEQRLLHLIAAFRMPAQFATLTAILVGSVGPFADEAQLDAALFNLEDRGLVGWDKRANRYDLHPVVRGVAWSTVDPAVQQGIYRELATHFEALPEIRRGDDVTSMDDLTPLFELYHTLVRLGRGKDAWKLLDDDLIDPAARLGAYRELGELCEVLHDDPAARADLEDDDEFGLVTAIGLMFQLSGQPWRYLEAYEKIIEEPGLKDDDHGAILAVRATAQHQVGDLIGAYRSVMESLAAFAKDPDDPWSAWFGSLALGALLATRGEPDAGAWLRDLRLADTDVTELGPFAIVATCELGHLAVRNGDLDEARRWARRGGQIAERGGFNFRLKVAVLRAAIALHDDNLERADEALYPALVAARETRLADEEACVLIMLAQRLLRGDDLVGARQRLLEAEPLIERGRLRLRRADARVVRSRVELAAGDRAKAAETAVEAWEAAWCDGPPFAYAEGLRQARDCLAATGTPEPTPLTGRIERDVPEPSLRPLSVQDVIKLAEDSPNRRVNAMRALAADPDEAGPDALLDLASTGSNDVQMAAIDVLADSERFDSAVWRRLWPRLANNTDHRVRRIVVHALIRTKDDDAVDFLVGRAEQDIAPPVRHDAASALVANHSHLERVPELVKTMAVTDPDNELRMHALDLLAGTSDVTSVRAPLLEHEELARFLWLRLDHEPEPSVQAHVVGLLLMDNDRHRWQQAFDMFVEFASKNMRLSLTKAYAALSSTSWGRAPDAVVRVLEMPTLGTVELRQYLADVIEGEGPAAKAALRRYADANPMARKDVFHALADSADYPDRILLSRDLDGLDPFLDPGAELTDDFVRQAAARLGIAEAETRAHYERLAEDFSLRLTWRE